MRTARRPTLAAASLALALALAGSGALVGCSGKSGDGDGAASSSAATCAARARTRVADRLTIATDSPALTPWFVGAPTSGKGYEGAVAVALARELGFAARQISWVSMPQDQIVAAGRKAFDLALDQVIASRVPAEQVELSRSYYQIPQALLGPADGAAAKAESLADIRALRLSALVGSPSEAYLTDALQPTTPIPGYNVQAEAEAQAAAGEIDALVLDLPTAIRAAEASGGTLEVIGQFAATNDASTYVAVLGAGSPLTTCVNQAIGALTRDGTLERLRKRWVGEAIAPRLPSP